MPPDAIDTLDALANLMRGIENLVYHLDAANESNPTGDTAYIRSELHDLLGDATPDEWEQKIIAIRDALAPVQSMPDEVFSVWLDDRASRAFGGPREWVAHLDRTTPERRSGVTFKGRGKGPDPIAAISAALIIDTE